MKSNKNITAASLSGLTSTSCSAALSQALAITRLKPTRAGIKELQSLIKCAERAVKGLENSRSVLLDNNTDLSSQAFKRIRGKLEELSKCAISLSDKTADTA